LALVIAFFVFINLLWWQQNKFVQGPDEGEHLYKSIEFYESGAYLREFLRPMVYYHDYNGPFFYSTAGIFYRLFNSSAYRVSILNILIYAVILLIGISRLERLFFNTAGFLSPLFYMLTPMGAIYSRFFNPDIAVCAILAWFMYFLKKLNDTVNPKYFFMSALLILIGGYTKVMFYLYAFFPLFCYLILAVGKKQARRVAFNSVLLASHMLSFYFIYPTHFKTLKGLVLTKTFTHLGDLGEIGLQVVNSQFGGIIFLFLVFSLTIFIFSNVKKENRFIMLACFFGPVLFIGRYFIFFELRYFLPLLIIESMIIGYGLGFLLRKRNIFRFTAIVFVCFSLVQYLGISFSKKWLDFFLWNTALQGNINLSHKPYYVNPLPFPANPLGEIMGVLKNAQKDGIQPSVCFIYDSKKEPFTEFSSKRLGYYTRRFQRFFYTVCDGYLTCTAGSVSEANFIIVSRSYLKEKTEVLSPESLFYGKGCLDNPEAYQPFLEEFESFLREGRFRLYRQVGAYDPVKDKKEQFFIYLRKKPLS